MASARKERGELARFLVLDAHAGICTLVWEAAKTHGAIAAETPCETILAPAGSWLCLFLENSDQNSGLGKLSVPDADCSCNARTLFVECICNLLQAISTSSAYAVGKVVRIYKGLDRSSVRPRGTYRSAVPSIRGIQGKVRQWCWKRTTSRRP